MTRPRQLPIDEDRKIRARQIVRRLKKGYPVALCALDHRSPFELLAATILSAQCTDVRVNKVTPELFRLWPNPHMLSQATQTAVESVIHSTGFFRSKAANLIGMARSIVENHDGDIPQTLVELVKLPGVGRKTANVLLGTAFGITSGVVVDTHVKRISKFLGLTVSDNPEQIEQDLMITLPKKEWISFSHRLIHHGRKICIARRPQCGCCPLLTVCPRTGLSELRSE
ncbi:MAG: endonuclease III [Planctomycetales bacterium]|jgi:endonuclease-3|nr:endonuclease III [Planctomycetales bacterium]